MKQQYERTARLIGEDGVTCLSRARVAVFGLGGVGGAAVEALARAGVGFLYLCDNDMITESNINRQLIATHATIGQPKTAAWIARVREIDPQIQVTAYNVFFLPETADMFDFSRYDYVIDAVDTVAAKTELIRRAKTADVPIISAMGAGNKLDPTAFRVADIEKTDTCPLARTVRAFCRKAGIRHVKVVYSAEQPTGDTLSEEHGRHTPGSISFVPPVMGYILAGEVIKDLLQAKENRPAE